ncbi:MAG: hypothetical protein GX649_06715 [Chloroflexi bacterium]|nr:hypothetical protein [Chloroflexota bacterium]
MADGTHAPEGLPVSALVEGAPAGEGLTRLQAGHVLYTLHVPADDPETAARDGGRAGDAVRLVLCGTPLEAVGAWQGGTNTRIDLTMPDGLSCQAAITPTASPRPSPRPTATPSPTTPRPMAAAPTAPPPETGALASMASERGAAPIEQVSARVEGSATASAPSPDQQARSGSLDVGFVSALAGILALGGLGLRLWRAARRG